MIKAIPIITYWKIWMLILLIDCIKKKIKKVNPITKNPYLDARSFCWYSSTGVIKSTAKAYLDKSGKTSKFSCANGRLKCEIFHVASNPLSVICLSFGIKLPLKFGDAQLEVYALLVGSIGLFLILAAVMYFSRKIEWNK